MSIHIAVAAGSLVAAFGVASWWYASRVLERSVDARITAQAQRMWNRVDPRTTVEEFQTISDAVFAPAGGEAPIVMVVKEHAQGTTIFSTQGAPEDLDAYAEVRRAQPIPVAGGECEKLLVRVPGRRPGIGGERRFQFSGLVPVGTKLGFRFL